MAPFHGPTIGPINSNLIDFHKDPNQFFFFLSHCSDQEKSRVTERKGFSYKKVTTLTEKNSEVIIFRQ
jgi:hypothetical protein